MKILLLLAVCATLSWADISCMDQNNQPVDWYIFYKIPRLKTHPNAHIANGTGFIYLDSNNKNQWVLPTMGMETGDHAVWYTLQHYYTTDKTSTFSIMYNDEFPNSTVWSDDSGHTKGVSVFSSTSGFWLIHSVPKFPSNQSYEWPSNAHTYGQMGICITYAYQQLGPISQQFFYNEPFIYEMSVPNQFGKDFPFLKRVQAGLFNTSPPYYNILSIPSKGGQRFTSFAKSGAWGKDLYYDLVAPTLKANLDVETWQHQSNESANLYSWCSSDKSVDVMNVEDVVLPFKINFTNYYDHSKYAVGFNSPGKSSLPWVCVGDINRQTHQEQRGGGTMCISDTVLHDVIYSPMVAKVYECKGTVPPPSQSHLRVNRIPLY